MQLTIQGQSPAETLNKLAYSVEEAVSITSMTRQRFYQAIAAGDVRTFMTGRRRFVTAEALREWIAKLEARSNPKAAA